VKPIISTRGRRFGAPVALIGALALALGTPGVAGAKKHPPCGKTKERHSHVNCGKHNGPKHKDKNKDKNKGESKGKGKKKG
jgi:hypothetical protein